MSSVDSNEIDDSFGYTNAAQKYKDFVNADLSDSSEDFDLNLVNTNIRNKRSNSDLEILTSDSNFPESKRFKRNFSNSDVSVLPVKSNPNEGNTKKKTNQKGSNRRVRQKVTEKELDLEEHVIEGRSRRPTRSSSRNSAKHLALNSPRLSSKKLPKTPTVKKTPKRKSKTNQRTRNKTRNASINSPCASGSSRTRKKKSTSSNSPVLIDLSNIDDQSQQNNISNEINHEVNVKVWWQFNDFKIFKIRKYQKLNEIFEFYAKRENLSMNRLVFILDEKIIKPSDTPASLNITAAHMIEGGCVGEKSTNVVDSLYTKPTLDKDTIQLKVQMKGRKRPIFIDINKSEPLHVLMAKCSEELALGLNTLKFCFDGDCIKPEDTTETLDIANGDCIDVYVK